MRILSLIPTLDPWEGGTPSAAVNMVIASHGAGARHTVAAAGTTAALQRARPMAEQLEERGVPVEEFPGLRFPRRKSSRWGLSPQMANWIWRTTSGFDLVHVHGVWGLGSTVGLAAGARHNTPVVVTAHESFTSFDIDDSPSRLRRRQKLWLKRAYLRWATLFLLTSRLEFEDSLAAAERRRAIAIPYPMVDSTGSLPPLRSRGTQGALRVGFLGRIHHKKNLDLLIGAIAQLPEHVRLTVAGDGPSAREARRRAEALGVGDRVTWLGFVSAERRESVFDGLDLLAMPSRFESFGMAAAEAMLHGVPVLVSDRTGIAEVIRRHGGGVIIEPHVSAITAAIQRLDRERAVLDQLGSAGQAAVSADLSFSQVGQAINQAYARALSHIGWPSP